MPVVAYYDIIHALSGRAAGKIVQGKIPMIVFQHQSHASLSRSWKEAQRLLAFAGDLLHRLSSLWRAPWRRNVDEVIVIVLMMLLIITIMISYRHERKCAMWFRLVSDTKYAESNYLGPWAVKSFH